MKTTAPSPELALRPYLRDGEELRWSGRPYASVRYRPHWLKFATVFFFEAAAISWEVDAIRDLLVALREDPEFAIFEMVFALFGLVANLAIFPTLWMFLVGAGRQLQRTAYGVTDSRVLILYPHKKAMILQEYTPNKLQSIDLQPEKDGTRTITFGNGEDDSEAPELGLAFYHIDDSRDVYELIFEIR